jgi:hypothetical protein
MRSLALILLLVVVSCLEYGEAKVVSESTEAANVNYPPIIDLKYVTPSPGVIHKALRLGADCPPQEFKIPPVNDRNLQDRLYYLWFLDKQLMRQGVIESEARGQAVISYSFDRQTLTGMNKGLNPQETFSQIHLVEFYLSDRPFLIPENAYIDASAFKDWTFWVMQFSDTPCFVGMGG